jgi:hypothetical protein
MTAQSRGGFVEVAIVMQDSQCEQCSPICATIDSGKSVNLVNSGSLGLNVSAVAVTHKFAPTPACKLMELKLKDSNESLGGFTGLKTALKRLKTQRHFHLNFVKDLEFQLSSLNPL